MPKFSDIYINQIPPNHDEDWNTFNIIFLKIGAQTKVGICPALKYNHSQLMENLFHSENIFKFHKQIGKNGKEVPKAEFYDEVTKKHGKIFACGLMTVDYRKKFIRFYGSSPEYNIGLKLLEVRHFMENYYSDSGFSYEVE
jgi:hypothetical protein